MYRHTGKTQVIRRVITKIFDLGFPKLSCTKYLLTPQIPMRLANYLKVRTTDGQTDGLMDQLFTLTWFLTTAFYEASVVTKFCGKTGAPRPLPLLRPGPEPFRFAKAFKPTYACLGTSLVFELIVGSSFIHCIHVEARVNCKRKQI